MATAIKLIEQGRIPKDETIVISITGNGLKTQEVVMNELPYPAIIEPKLSEFDKLLDHPMPKEPSPRRDVVAV